MFNTMKDWLDKLYSKLKVVGIDINEEQRLLLEDKLQKQFEYIPRIGVFGQTGVGKSSFINAVFGEKICDVSNVDACTRELQEVKTGNIVLIDFPGIGEDPQKDIEYQNLYNEQIPKLDAILWVLDSSSRAYANDINFYKQIRNNFKTKEGNNIPLFFVLNKVDKMETNNDEEWDKKNNKPGTERMEGIKAKINDICLESRFGVGSNIVFPVSAKYCYNLVDLIVNLLSALPKDRAAIIYMAQQEKIQAKKAESQVKTSTSVETTRTSTPVVVEPPIVYGEPMETTWTDPRVREAGQGGFIDTVLDFAERIPVIGGPIKVARKVGGFLKELFF